MARVRVPAGPFFVTFHFELNYSFFVGPLGLVGLGFSIRLVLSVRVSFYVYSMDSKSFWTTIDVFVAYIGRIADRLLL